MTVVLKIVVGLGTRPEIPEPTGIRAEVKLSKIDRHLTP